MKQGGNSALPKVQRASLVYPHQLFVNHPAVEAGRIVYLIEEPLFFKQYPFHRQKLMLHRSSMRRYAAELEAEGYAVRYMESLQLSRTESVVTQLRRDGIVEAQVVDPEDNWLQRRLQTSFCRCGIELNILPNPNFLTPVDLVDNFQVNDKKLFFTAFYIEQRKRLGILIDEHRKPFGGKWSYDPDNRKKLPKAMPVPEVQLPNGDGFDREARSYVTKNFPQAIGTDRALIYPSSRSTALAWLEDFLDRRLASFGDYEDAMVDSEPFLFHAILTPMLNVGLLEPGEVIDAALRRIDRVPLNSMEGFIRQVIGWREFIRVVYRRMGSKQRTTNSWSHYRKIPPSFYDGTTGIDPVDVVIRRVLDLGYCHHIERLMVLGNFMLLCEFDPDEVYRWFMEMFVDAYDWVMVPNVYGMSQHADAGLMTTKPYISGSSYILRMSNFTRGAWCEVWDALYWRFIAEHRSFFEKNPRLNVMTKQLDRMGDKLVRHRRVAEGFLSKLTLEAENDSRLGGDA